MELTYTIYIGGSILFLAALTYAFVYSARLKTRKKTMEAYGRPPVSLEEGIAVATEDRQGRDPHAPPKA